MTFEREDDRVTLTLNNELWERLLFALALATNAAWQSEGRAGLVRMLSLVNAINEGNPHFTPYVLPDVPPKAES